MLAVSSWLHLWHGDRRPNRVSTRLFLPRWNCIHRCCVKMPCRYILVYIAAVIVFAVCALYRRLLLRRFWTNGAGRVMCTWFSLFGKQYECAGRVSRPSCSYLYPVYCWRMVWCWLCRCDAVPRFNLREYVGFQLASELFIL